MATIFTKLCYSEYENEVFDTVEVSEVIPMKDMNFFKKGSWSIPENDKRFHYEDDILQPEPLDSFNKSDNRIRNELIDSDVSSED